MADKKITDLPQLTVADFGDLVPIVDGSANITKKVPAEGVVPAGAITTVKLGTAAVTHEKIDFGATPLTIEPRGGKTLGASSYATSFFGGRAIGGYIQVSGPFDTNEGQVAQINLPRNMSSFIFRGGVDATGSRVCIAFISNTGLVTVQGSDTFTGTMWFTFFYME